MQKCSAKHQWSYRSANIQHCAEDVKDMVRSLMETQAIDNAGLLQLKTETYPPCNPTVIMDLRHKMKKVNRGLSNYKNNDAIKDARRMIRAEDMERLTIEKELQGIDNQINNFQKDLNGYKVKIDKTFDARHKNRQCEAHKITVADVEDLLLESINYNERLLKTKQQESSLNVVPSLSASQNIIRSSNTYRNVEYKQQNRIDILEDLNPHTVKCNTNALLDNRNLMMKTWNMWRVFINEKKLINSAQQETNLVELNAEHEENRRLLKKYFALWHEFTKAEQLLKKATAEKLQQKQKIDVFLATLQEKKQIIRKKNRRNFIEIKCKSANNISEFSSDTGGRQGKENGNKHHNNLLPCHLKGTSFRHRFQAQQHIIAEQKSKLEEQKKIIEELKLAQLNKDSEKSEKKSQEHLSRMLQNCSTMLKPKAKYLCRSLPSAIEHVPENNSKQYFVPSLVIQPTFLSKMTERSQERQKRWKLIQEKKRIQKEEKQRHEREKEQQRLQQEKEERKLMLEDIQKMKLNEREKELKRQQEKERLKALNHKAIEHYKTFLLRKYGICAFKKLISLRDRKMEIADAHYRNNLLCRHFVAWKTFIQNFVEWKMCKADSFYRNLLMKRTFRRFQEIYHDYKLKKQVALDIYDLHLQKWAFTEWHHVVCLNHIERISKMEKAKLHYERKLLMRCLQHWIKFPEAMHKEKQRERRKEFWRSKVQELLPDFRPVLCTSDIIPPHGYLY